MKIFEWPADSDQIEKFFQRSHQPSAEIEESVRKIIADVRRHGDKALVRYTRKFDGVMVQPDALEIPQSRLKVAWKSIPRELQNALNTAARRIKAFHSRQQLSGWVMDDPTLGRMELRVQPLERVGVYVPGGTAPLPSTVLMGAIPAKVAGVKEICLITPPSSSSPDGMPAEAILAAAHLAGVSRVFRAGGAQAIAALACGTDTIPKVDKIVGPGNIYVATAKKMLYGEIDIDSVAGPSEVLIIADNDAPLEYIAADMLAQAEHDTAASAGAILIGASEARALRLTDELKRQLKSLSRNAIASKSIARNGYIIRVKSEKAALEIADRKAPEHLEIMTKNARALSGRIRNAGAIFIGPYSPEALGDYMAGPNHTLPTAGTARFFSPLSVWSFYKTCHTIEATQAGLAEYSKAIETLADAEGLTAHAESIRKRR